MSSDTAADLLKLKRTAEKAKEQRIRAEVAVDKAERDICDLGYTDIKSAEKAFKNLTAELSKKEEALQDHLHSLYQKYPDLK